MHTKLFCILTNLKNVKGKVLNLKILDWQMLLLLFTVWQVYDVDGVFCCSYWKKLQYKNVTSVIILYCFISSLCIMMNEKCYGWLTVIKMLQMLLLLLFFHDVDRYHKDIRTYRLNLSLKRCWEESMASTLRVTKLIRKNQFNYESDSKTLFWKICPICPIWRLQIWRNIWYGSALISVKWLRWLRFLG